MTLFVLMSMNGALIGIYDTKEAALAARARIWGVRSMTTSSMSDYSIHEVPYHHDV
jgi:hypothetical protein